MGMQKKTIKKICITLGCTAFFLFFIGLSAVQAEVENDNMPENDPNALTVDGDMQAKLFNDDTGTAILGKTLVGGVKGDARELARDIIFTILGVLGTVMVAAVLYAGFLWVTASGEEEKVKKAQHYLWNAIIGAILVMSAWTISIFVLEALKKTAIGIE